MATSPSRIILMRRFTADGKCEIYFEIFGASSHPNIRQEIKFSPDELLVLAVTSRTFEEFRLAAFGYEKIQVGRHKGYKVKAKAGAA
jgi:hypothetical protein